MDAQELPAVIVRCCVQTLSDCSRPLQSANAACAASICRRACALEAIDGLLRQDRSAVRGEEADLLLDLRWQLRRQDDPETTLRIFCDLRRRMEERHYLAFFRLRRWLENHVVAVARRCPAGESNEIPVRLSHYCVEAIRRACLCAGLGRGTVLLAPRLTFEFRKPASQAVDRSFALAASR